MNIETSEQGTHGGPAARMGESRCCAAQCFGSIDPGEPLGAAGLVFKTDSIASEGCGAEQLCGILPARKIARKDECPRSGDEW